MERLQDNYLTNEYESLLNFLEDQKENDNSRKIKSEVSIKKKKEIDLKKKVKKETRSILEECTIDTDTILKKNKKLKRKKVNITKGFEVKKFESLMRSKLIDEYKKLQSYDRPYLSVTEIISCIRRAYYQRQKYPIDIKSQYRFPYIYLINNVGNTVHDCIQSLYNFEEVEKTIISEKYKIKGRIDGIRGVFLIELKTIDEEKFTGNYIPQHYHQGLLYSYILNEEYNYEIKVITIVYIIRNLKKIYPFDLPYEISKVKPFLEASTSLKNALSSQRVPDPINGTKEQCTFCPYIKICIKDKSTIELPFNKKANNILDKSNMNNSLFTL